MYGRQSDNSIVSFPLGIAEGHDLNSYKVG